MPVWRVRFPLVTAIVMPRIGPLGIVGPLALVAARREFGGNGDANGRYGTDAWVRHMELPLRRENGVWAASSAQWPTPGAVGSVTVTKKSDWPVIRGTYAVTGSTKQCRDALTTAIAPFVEFLVEPERGREGDLRSLLGGICNRRLGGMTRLGYGFVLAPQVEVVDMPSAVWDENKQPTRPVPVRDCPAGFTPDWGVTTRQALVPDPPTWAEPAVLCYLPAQERWLPKTDGTRSQHVDG